MIPFTWYLGKAKTVRAVDTSLGWNWGGAVKGSRGSGRGVGAGDDGTIPYLDKGGGYVNVRISQNSQNFTPKEGRFCCTEIIIFKWEWWEGRETDKWDIRPSERDTRNVPQNWGREWAWSRQYVGYPYISANLVGFFFGFCYVCIIPF